MMMKKGLVMKSKNQRNVYKTLDIRRLLTKAFNFRKTKIFDRQVMHRKLRTACRFIIEKAVKVWVISLEEDTGDGKQYVGLKDNHQGPKLMPMVSKNVMT